MLWKKLKFVSHPTLTLQTIHKFQVSKQGQFNSGINKLKKKNQNINNPIDSIEQIK